MEHYPLPTHPSGPCLDDTSSRIPFLTPQNELYSLPSVVIETCTLPYYRGSCAEV